MRSPSVVLLLLLPALPAQGGVAPPAYAVDWGNTVSSASQIAYSLARWQQLIESSALPAGLQVGDGLDSVGWRPALGEVTGSAPVLAMEIRVYDTGLTAAGMSASFAANLAGASGGVVFARRTVRLPPITEYGNPADSFLVLPFDAPHPFVGPNLLVEVENDDGQTVVYVYPRRLDACAGPRTLLAQTGASCGTTRNLLQPMTSAGRLSLQLIDGPPNAVAVAFFGLGVVSQGGIRLPLPLDLLGLKGCQLFVSLDAQLPVALDSRGFFDLPIPTPPFLYSQWAVFDPAANPAGLAMSNAAYIRTRAEPCAMTQVYRTGPLLPTGWGPFAGGDVTFLGFR